MKKRTPRRPEGAADQGETDTLLKRHVAIRAEDVDHEARKVSVSISSETDKIRGWGGVPEVLLHERSSVDLGPLREVGAVLMNHDPNQIVGRPENVRLDEKDRKIRADIVFDEDPESQRAFEKVKSGSLRGVSVGFKVSKWRRVEEGTKWDGPSGRSFDGPVDVATKWSILEFSLTPIPADSAVGVGRSNVDGREPERKLKMKDKLKAVLVKRGLDPNASDEEAQDFILRAVDPPEPPKPAPGGEGAPAPVESRQPSDASPAEESARLAAEAEKRERDRGSEIVDLIAAWPSHREMISTMYRDGATVGQVRKAVLAEMQRERPAARPAIGGSRVEFGEDGREKFRRAATDSLLLRVNRLKREEDEAPAAWSARRDAAREACGFSLFDLMRTSLRQCGISDRGSKDELMVRAFSHSTSDFPAILKDAANKRLLQAYSETPSTWRPLCRIGNASDFKTLNRPKFGNMGNLVLTPDLVPMSEGSTLDVNESFAISTYTKRFGIGRQAIINDDLSAFDRIPTEIGNAAARTVTDTFYNLLISASGVGPTMAEDAVALFATTHTSGANYIAATGAPDVAGLGALMKFMRLQKGLVSSGETAPILNVQPRFLLVPAALEITAMQTVGSIGDPAKSNDITKNPFSNLLTLIVEPRLDAGTNGATAWYLIANPDQTEGAEVAFLNGNDTPTMYTEVGNNVLGTAWGVVMDFGVKFIEHRGWARTRGA
jgi:HK97 family phage prohead protease